MSSLTVSSPATMLLRVVLFMLSLATYSLSTPLHKSHHSSRKLFPRHSSSFPNFDKHTAVCILPRSLSNSHKTAQLAVQAATRQKFRNAPALLVGQGTSPGYTIPPSLQDTYNRASDYATSIALHSSQVSSANSSSNPSSTVRLASVGTLGCVNNAINISLLDDTDSIDDFEYYGPLRFGSQEQSLDIDLDTGSAGMASPLFSKLPHQLV